MQFVGRDGERREIDRLLASAAAGRGGAVVVAGEAGIGKSALLDAAVGALDGWEVLRAAGTEFEQDLLYAVLHQLCAPLLDHRRALPAVQRAALETVFGLGEQTSPDPLTVGLAVLGLLAEAAREHPVCCLWTTRSGSTRPHGRSWCSWRAGWAPNASRWCSPPATPRWCPASPTCRGCS
ncbi:AAA family ATPase [Streptomyces sp. NPDC017941]|uniref:AAA family ATPase n=1 Tax=Streptomyces sp. NPDC017941 TaxID=3365018 RepID=UPI0037A714E3